MVIPTYNDILWHANLESNVILNEVIHWNEYGKNRNILREILSQHLPDGMEGKA